MTWLVAKLKEYVLEPFSSWDNFRSAIMGGVKAITTLEHPTGWLFLFSAIVISFLAYYFAKKRGELEPATTFRKFIFPKEIFTHPSAVVDYKFAFLDLSLRDLLYSPLVGAVSILVYKGVLALTGGAAAMSPAAGRDFNDKVIFTVVTFLIADFGFFVSHMLMHEVPLLWHFHEVHHTAEVMTPITVYRIHPVERVISTIVGGVLGGLSAAVYSYSSQNQLAGVTILGVNALLFVFYDVVAALRHSHVWVSYGRVLERILISPAQHQIHHSSARKHWDKNYGFVLGIWDGIFGSLYVPRGREHIVFGVPNTDPNDFSTVGKLYALPFKKAWRHLRYPKSVKPMVFDDAPDESDARVAPRVPGAAAASTAPAAPAVTRAN